VSISTTTTYSPTSACSYPNAAVIPGAATYAAMPNPYYMGLAFYGIAADGVVYDYTAAGYTYSSVVDFIFYDYYGYPMCDIAYDASGAVSTSGWVTDSGGALFASYDLPLSGGQSSCGLVYGYDLRSVIEYYSWGIGFGQLAGLQPTLQSIVTASGQDWTTDWAPYTYAIYVEGGLVSYSGTAVEAGWATSLDRDCGTVLTDAYGYGSTLYAPTSGPLDVYVNANPLLIFPFPLL